MLAFFRRFRRQNVFSRIQIQLTGPICDCDVQDLSWWISRDGDGRSGLVVECNGCGCELRIPNKRFKACFQLDKPYPGRKDNVVQLDCLDGGKKDDKANKD